MAEIGDSSALQDWLNEKPVEFACVLAARVALRVAPVLEIALHEDQEGRRRDVILPSFCALAASSFACAWPGRAGEVCKVARTAGQEASAAISELVDGARISVFEAQEAIPEIQQAVWRFESDARALGVAERAVDATVEATQSVIAVVGAAEGIGTSAAVYEAAVSATPSRKRALVVAGAGAALEFGAPSTADLTELVRERISADDVMQHFGCDQACNRIDEKLSDYLVGGSEAVNFEHIFHCAQEILANTFEPTAGAFNEFRPILYPFVGRWVASNEQTALTELVRRIPELLFSGLSAASDDPRISLALLTEFLDHLRKTHVTRIYTTNYDDFILQAAPDLHHGFDTTLATDQYPSWERASGLPAMRIVSIISTGQCTSDFRRPQMLAMI